MKTGLLLLSAMLMVAAVGCSDGSRETVAVQVSLLVAAPAAGPSFAPDVCGNSLTSAKLVFRRIKLNGDVPDCTTPDGIESGDDSDPCELEVSVGPFLVDIAGADFNGVFQAGILTTQVPVGTYDRARFNLHKLDEGTSASGDAALQSMIDAEISVAIEGATAGGDPFTFTTDVNDEQEKGVSLVVGDAVTGVEGITLTVDPSAWLGQAGECLDPLTDGDVIEENIRSSIDLEDDDGQDGSS
jgi:hypothetical protein